MHEFTKILVATDTRLDDHPIVDEAAEIAMHCGASLKIVDVAPEFSWTVRLTMSDHEHLQELICQEKAVALEALAEPIRQRGIEVETKVLKGKTSVEIIREVLRADHDLVIRVAKGQGQSQPWIFWYDRCPIASAMPLCCLARFACHHTEVHPCACLRRYFVRRRAQRQTQPSCLRIGGGDQQVP